MSLSFKQTELKDIIEIQPVSFPDNRGLFFETYHIDKYKEGGIEQPFVQDNFSNSKKGVLRGMHYQLSRPQAKLVSCLRGEIYDVAVDIRKDSDSFGKWIGVTLSAENKKQLYIPEGFAHGFCVLSEEADVHYKCTDVYVPADDRGLNFSDPEIGIAWPIAEPILSAKDAELPKLTEVNSSELP